MKKSKVKVDVAVSGRQRRKFLKLGGLALAGSGLLIACGDDDDINIPEGGMDDVFDLGSGDRGVLNYAYALEQLEAAFYTNVVNNMYSGASTVERTLMQDLYNHEVNHREFFKAALNANFNADQVLPEMLEFDFSSVDFSNRAQVLGTARLLEDTGVGAYNGAAKYLNTGAFLTLAGKIVSVEARHAAAIRTLIAGDGSFLDNDPYKSFAGDDIVDDNGLDAAMEPSDVIRAAGSFFVTPFSYNNPQG
ncbi:MAG: ferritin-like domain-containing protein [Leeuwenhoekiella sp.]